jgi:peptidoglycan/LPS O-acetylase OafA/YrhL
LISNPALKGSAYIHTLDGWRALSIGLVILHHSQIHSSVPILGPLLQSLARVSEVGVELFFAISRLLICSGLLDEESRVGQISIKGFYVRRFFRILPVAIFYLLVIAILETLHVIPVFSVDWFAALFFFRNYAMVFEYLNHSPLPLHRYTSHFWSLSMEEHFYLVLPAVLAAFRRTCRWVLAGMAVSVALRRTVLTHVLHRDYQFNFRTDTHVDALLIPAMIALSFYPLTRNKAARRFVPVWSFPMLVAMEFVLLATRVPFFFTLQGLSCSPCSFFLPCFTPTRCKEESWKRSRSTGLGGSPTVCIYGGNFSLASISPEAACVAQIAGEPWRSCCALPSAAT